MSRISYAKLAPKPYEILRSLGHYLNTETAIEPVLLHLLDLRVSTLNGCSFCIGMHTAELRRANEPQSRIDAVKDWKHSDAFTPRERAALRWADALTKLTGAEISDQEYAAVNEYFREKDLADLTFSIARINAWNRLGVAFASEWNPPTPRPKE